MAVNETQEFEWLNLLKKIVKRVYRKVCNLVLLERETEHVRCVWVKKKNTYSECLTIL